ncbi:MAG: hypothetical protein HY936_07150 [Nitrosomonadales bacterium]|nr:hypothetical protein [Nitrosomonadales bacterium]
MDHRLLLFLSANRLHAQLMEGDRIASQQEFDNSHEGRQGFAAFLQPVKSPAYLLADLIEEDFRQETIPHLSGRSQSALLQRKFDQYYRGTPFHLATLLQRQKTGRRDDEMLFSALTNPALITPWVDIMQAHKIPLAGIYSVPQVSASLVKDHASDHLLLISWEKSAGLRQSYFNKRSLQVSRLTPVHAASPFHETVAKELGRTCQYLKSLSLLPDGQNLDVCIMGHGDDIAGLQGNLPQEAGMRYEFASLDEVAMRLKINCRFADSDASQIFMRELVAKPPKTHYAKAAHTHHFGLWRLRNALNRLSGAVLVGSLLWGAANVMLNNGNATAVDSLNIQTQRALLETRQITQEVNGAFHGARASAGDMKAGVTIMRKLDRYAPNPQAILKPISAVLDHFPQINLDNIDWRINATGSDTNDAAAVTGQIPVTENTATANTATTITLRANLHGFASDYRAALAYLDRFQRELSATGYRVTIVDKPLDIGSGGSIAGRRETQEKTLDFSLRLVRETPA